MRYNWILLLFFVPAFLSAQNIPHTNFAGPLGSSVNTYNGNLFLSRNDLFIPDQGIAIDLVFSYNSLRDTIDYGYGLGWNLNFGMLYHQVADTVLIEHGDGRVEAYRQNGSNYTPPAGIFNTLSSPGSGQFVLTTKYGMEYHFENAAHRQITQVRDPNGNVLTLTYSPEGELTGMTDPSGRSIQLVWTDQHLMEVIDNNVTPSRNITYNYDGAGHLLGVTNLVGNTRQYSYNDQGCIASQTNENGDLLSIFYYENRSVGVLVSCFTKLEFKYNTEQNNTYVIQTGEGEPQVTTFDYDEDGRLIRKSGNCCGYDMSYGYDGDNNLNQRTDANGNSQSASHDGNGNTLLTTDALGGQMLFNYSNSLNRISSLKDKRNNTTSFGYDGTGNVTSIAQPGNTTQLAYNGNGNVSSIQDGNNLSTSFDYNNNNLTSIQYPIGNETFTYDGVGNLKSRTDANSLLYNYEYDAANRLKKVTDPLNHSWQLDYDGNSNLVQETDPNQNQKTYGYDAHNRLTSVTTPTGGAMYGYDGFDNLTSLTDGNGNTSIFEYDSKNRVISERDPLGNTTFYAYDSNGNMIQRTDPKGQVTNYSYDALNRMISRQYGDNTDYYVYDENNNLTQSSNNYISISYTYDALNRMTSQTINNWGKTISYTYDAVGNRMTMTDPDNGLTSYSYDDNYRLTQITNAFNQVTTFDYDLGGRMTRMDHDNGTYAIYDYDDADRVTSIIHYNSGGQEIGSFAYSYDNNGNRLSCTEQGNQANNYSYDGDNRLLTASYANGVFESYSYDPAGNRSSLTTDGNTTSYTYDAGNRLTKAGTAIYMYDANGNLISKSDNGQMTSYTYDMLDRLMRVELPSGENVSYKYDPFGNRIERAFSGGGITRYVYDGENLLQELNGNNVMTAQYTSMFELDSWISMAKGGAHYFYHKDAIGSTRLLSATNGTVVAEYSYDAYGNISTQSGSVENPYTYTGRAWDAEGEFFYYRTRFYDAQVGRFLTLDGFSGFLDRPLSLNKYLYTEGNPITFNDPEGDFLPILAGIVIQGIARFAVKTATEWTVKRVLGGAALGFIDELIDNDLRLDCVDWVNVGIDAFFGSSLLGPYNGITKLLRKDPLYLTKVSAKRRVNGSIRRTRKRLGRRAARPTKEEYNELIDDVAKVQRRDFAETAVEGIVKSKVKKGLKSQGSYSFSDCNDTNGDQEKGFFEDFQPGIVDIIIFILESHDPNEIVGPPGVGAQKWVSGEQTLPYTIFFENDPDFATGPAQRVTIYHEFDETINPFSFRVGDFGFGSQYFEVPDGISYYTNQINLTDSLGVLLEVAAGLDVDNNRAFWILESKDPETGLASTLPADLGFLPVNDSLLQNGEGFVNFTAKAATTAETFDLIEARASIIFDDNPPIGTNIAINTLDVDAPETRVATIDTLSGGYEIYFLGNDVGSGLDHYQLHVSTNGGPFLPLLDQLTNSSVLFPAHPDSTYGFFTIGVDSVGNVEPLKDMAEGDCMAINVVQIVNATPGNADGQIEVEIIGNDGAVTYEWAHDDQINGPLASNLIPGEYVLVATDESGCSVQIVITVDQANSIDDPKQRLEARIERLYPVPASDRLFIDFISYSEAVTIQLFSTNGQLLKTEKVSIIPSQLTTYSLGLGGLPAGTYLVRLQSDTEQLGGIFLKI